MSLFDKFRNLAKAREALLESGCDPFSVVLDEVLSSTEGIIGGRRTILAGTNNYLGLTFHQDCIDAAGVALAKEGTGTTGSRMANGTFSGHVALEREIAEFYQVRSSIVFSTGYLANLGMLSTLAGSDDVILLDADCHASIYDGCRMGDAEVIRFRHNNSSDLEKRMRRLGDRATRTIILVEGIYSMLGDRAPLKEIAEIKKKYNAFLVVDEAHSLGVLGQNGRGLAEEAGVEDSVDLIVGTFSKSLGATGGFCVSNHPELDMIRFASRPYIFTASPSPSVIASTRAALQILKTQPALRKKLWENVEHLYKRLQRAGFKVGPEPSPVVATLLDTKEEGIRLWKELMENGVYVNLVLPPAAPGETCLLRCSVSAGHSEEQIESICLAFESFK